VNILDDQTLGTHGQRTADKRVKGPDLRVQVNEGIEVRRREHTKGLGGDERGSGYGFEICPSPLVFAEGGSESTTTDPRDHRREAQGSLGRTVLCAYPRRCCAGGMGAGWTKRCDTPREGFSFRDQDQVPRDGGQGIVCHVSDCWCWQGPWATHS
jgi:hypothetical protein